jgi:hypothetical protein
MPKNQNSILRNISTSKLLIILAFALTISSFLEIELPNAFATTTEWISEISVGILETEPTALGIDLQIITHSNDGLKLEWNAPQISDNQILTGYEILRKTSYSDYVVIVKNLNPTKTTYLDLELPIGYYGYLIKPILDKKPYDPVTKHGIDRKNNMFNSYLVGQELLAKQTLNKILSEKSIQKESIEEPLTHYSNFLKRSEDPILQNQIKQEILKAEKIFFQKFYVQVNH